MMKHILIAVGFTLIAMTSNGQLKKRYWLVGGDGSFYSYSENYSTPNYNQTAKTTSAEISASVGYFMIDKLVAGIRPYLSTTKSVVTYVSVGSGGKNYGFQIAVGPFIRYYFLNIEKPYNILADVSYQIGMNKFKGTPPAKGKFNTLKLMAGPEVFFNETAGIELLLGYSQRTVSIEDAPNAFNRKRSGFQISIGFTIHLTNY